MATHWLTRLWIELSFPFRIKRKLCTLLLCFTVCVYSESLYIEPAAGIAPIEALINQAQQSITVTLYGFTEKHLLAALINAHDRGVTINVLLEPTPYKAERENKATIATLLKHGIAVHRPHTPFQFIHQKSLLIDQSTALIMTGNFTYSGFHRQRNFIFLTHDQHIIQAITQQYRHDSQGRPFSPTVSELLWSPNNSRRKLKRFILETKNELDIYAQTITDPEMTTLLGKKATTHNAVIQLLLPNKARKEHCNILTQLKKHQVRIRLLASPYVHAKAMIQDQRHAFIGSINLTSPSLDTNRELGILIDHPETVSQLYHQFNRDWSHASAFQSC